MSVSELDCARQILETGPRLARWTAGLMRRESVLASFTVPQFRVLLCVQRCGPCSQSDVAHWRNVAAATMSRTVDALVEKGLLARSTAPEDRRVAMLRLTPAGERFLVEARTQMERALAAALAGTTEAQRATIAADLVEMANLLRPGAEAELQPAERARGAVG